MRRQTEKAVKLKNIDKLNALIKSGSPGPWNVVDKDMVENETHSIARTFETSEAALIAAARNALPYLLDIAHWSNVVRIARNEGTVSKDTFINLANAVERFEQARI